MSRAGHVLVQFAWLTIAASPLAPAQSDTPLFGLPPQRVSEGAIELTFTVDRPAALIAEPITLRFQVDAPKGTTISFPPWDSRLGQFSVTHVSAADALPIKAPSSGTMTDRRRWIVTMQLESLETGMQQIPPIEVLYELPAGPDGVRDSQGVLRTEPTTLQITSVLEEEADLTKFRDIKDVAEVPAAVAPRSIWPWIAAPLVCLIGAVMLIFLYRRRSQPTPKRWALDQVDRIEARLATKSMGMEEVYAQLSTVIREYLETELSITATALSTEELAAELEVADLGPAFPPSASRRLHQFMCEADELKFSGALNGGGERDSLQFESIRAIIHDTQRPGQPRSKTDCGRAGRTSARNEMSIDRSSFSRREQPTHARESE